MNEVDENFEAPVEALSAARDIRGKLKACCGGSACAERAPKQVEYLWLHVGQHGIGRTGEAEGASARLHTEDWLNILDEAASLGAKWLVISVSTSLAGLPELVQICQWAQDAHEMGVAIHTTAAELSSEEIDVLRQLDVSRVRLFVCQGAYASMKALEAHGLRVCVADAEPVAREGCGMPHNMLFVNGHGELYTCGMVEGQQEYHLGSIFQRRFDNVITDPALPHAIPADAPYHEHGCDGCPPLLSKALKDC